MATASAGKYFVCGPQFSVSRTSRPRASSRRSAAGRCSYCAGSSSHRTSRRGRVRPAAIDSMAYATVSTRLP